MSASKDKERGTWKIYLRYVDWQGVKQIHTKRGFATKREALEYEREFLASKSRDLNMLFESFVEIYLNDLRPRIKYNTYLTKVHIINKGRKKEYKPNGKTLPTVVEAHIHMVLFCNPASTIVEALKSYLNKKNMKAVVWDRHCNSRVEVENAVEYAMRQSRKVCTIDYDRKDVLSVDEWGYYEAVEKAEAKIKNNMAFTKSEPEHTPETFENKSVPSISDTPETLTYKSIKHNYLYYIVPTFCNRSIIKVLLQNVIYYGRESSRRCCSKNIITKVLLKVPLLLENIKLCDIIIRYDTDRLLENSSAKKEGISFDR